MEPHLLSTKKTIFLNDIKIAFCFQPVTALEQISSLGSHHSQSMQSCTVWVCLARSHLQRNTKFHEQLTATEILSSIADRPANYQWLGPNLPSQPDICKQTWQVWPSLPAALRQMGCGAQGDWCDVYKLWQRPGDTYLEIASPNCLASCFLWSAFDTIQAAVLIQQQNLGITTVLQGSYLGFFA